MIKRRVTASVLLLAVILMVGCAARAPRAKVQLGSLAVGEAVLGFDQVERQLYQGGAYDKASHDRMGAVVIKLLYGARAYERAAASWVEGQPSPATVNSARDGLLAALNDLQNAIPKGTTASDALLKALAAIRVVLALPQAQAELPLFQLAQLPGGGLMGFLVLLNVLATLLESGRTTFERIRGFLQQEGATPEELAAMDARLSAAIAEREAEHPGAPE